MVGTVRPKTIVLLPTSRTRFAVGRGVSHLSLQMGTPFCALPWWFTQGSCASAHNQTRGLARWLVVGLRLPSVGFPILIRTHACAPFGIAWCSSGGCWLARGSLWGLPCHGEFLSRFSAYAKPWLFGGNGALALSATIVSVYFVESRIAFCLLLVCFGEVVLHEAFPELLVSAKKSILVRNVWFVGQPMCWTYRYTIYRPKTQEKDEIRSWTAKFIASLSKTVKDSNHF